MEEIASERFEKLESYQISSSIAAGPLQGRK
jgi:hypothetical protein